jgi:K+-sensing histidine kinase KdpD
MAVLAAGMLPLRDHLSIATTALILVIPVVVGVAIGGFRAGAVSVLAGFIVYDFFFIPPYLTFEVGASENWVALGVYVLVMLPVAHLVARMNTARDQAHQRGEQIRRLFDLSTLLVEDRPLPDLLDVVVTTLRDLLDARHVALLLPDGAELRIAAATGAELTPAEREQLQSPSGRVITPDPLTTPATSNRDPLRLALVAAGRPVGLLVITGATVTDQAREPLLLFANQIALAVERSQLQEQALRVRLTEEVEHMARTLVAAVSHDLRTPLASIKASSSVLADPQLSDEATRHDLATLVDTQTDRLAALVSSLLDMSRVQAGVLQPRTRLTAVTDLITTVLRELPGAPPREIVTRIDERLPLLDIDPMLVARVLTNLLDNAARYAPPGTPITVRACQTDPGTVTIAVADRGPGIPANRRDEIFGLFVRRDTDTGTGLGLAIAKTFIHAHHQRIWVDPTPDGGACFCFTLPAATGLPTPVETSTGRSQWPRSSSSTTTSPCSPPVA